MRTIAPSTILCAALLVWTPSVFADGIDQLEQSLKTVAASSIPRTVLINVKVADGREGAGSGALISSDGYILTCSHVVEIGKTIDVVTSDGTHYPGTVLGRNVRQDYALVKIDAQGLSCFEVGDSNTVQAGDWVVALGHPGGPYPDVQPAFAAGKVRGLEGHLPVGMMEKYYNHAIITDAPIFAGDSGGPLVNLDGKLVGINGAIVMINDLAFAVPIDQIMTDLDRLKAGEVIQGEAAGPQAFQDMQKLVSPEDYQKMMSRAFKNFGKMFSGKDNPFGELFGKDSPFKGLFGNGEMPDLGKLFGGGNGEMPDLGKLFGGGQNGEAPDMGKMLEKLQEMLGGQNGNGENPFSKLFGGGQNGEAPDMGKMLEKLNEMFGGGNGNGENPLGKLFGGQQPGAGEAPPKAFLGVQIDQNANVDGLLVQSVVPGSSAEKGGIQKGDVIVAIDGRAVGSFETLIETMREKEVGQEITVDLDRAELMDTVLVTRRISQKLTLGARPE